MAEPSPHINYSFEDIQRYLQGRMSAAEMHAIEKAALQDPFLADAIEGFHNADLTTAQQHLNEINASLVKEKKESKVVAFNKRSQLLNVAALIIVLAGIGVVTSYFLGSSNQPKNVAQIKHEPAKNEVAKDSTTDQVNAFTPKPDTTALIAEIKKPKKIESLKAKKIITEKETDSLNPAAEQNNVASADVAMAPVPSVQQDKMAARSFSTPSASQEKTDSTQAVLRGRVSGLAITPSTFSGKVIDVNNDPVPFATLQLNNSHAMTTDAEGNFTLKANNDTVMNLTASAVGYKTQTTSIQSYRSNVIVLDTAHFSSSDVIVTTALGSAKKSKTPSDSAMPVGGWKNFNKYVTEQLNKDTTTQSVTNPDDIVEVEFLIDKMGNPYDIKVVKSLDDQHNAKAIDILRKGPKWTNTSKKKKAKVSISF